MTRSFIIPAVLCSLTLIMLSACPGISFVKDSRVKIMTLDPGHFHAALVQKKMYPQVSTEVNVYAPAGDDVKLHLARIDGFNSRDGSPTAWKEIIYCGNDFFEKMIAEKPGNVVVLSGNNAKKTDYILKSVKEGINILADKPMVINPKSFNDLKEAFKIAEDKGLFIYDIMTERYEITTMLQKEMSSSKEVFGDLLNGTPDNPAITKESVHYFFKYVSGKPLIRPPWFFDTNQQGEGIVDVTTHLVDLVQWECFPDTIINPEKDVKIINAKTWPTLIKKDEFQKVTGLEDFPEYLKKDIDKKSILNVNANGEFVYTLKGVHAKISVVWDFKAPEGCKDTHFSKMRGTLSELIIRQGKDEGFKPKLFVRNTSRIPTKIFEARLQKAVTALCSKYPGLSVVKHSDNEWNLVIPDSYAVGHEAHFGQVMEKYLSFFETGKMPDWEVPNMIAKYYTTMEAYKKSRN